MILSPQHTPVVEFPRENLGSERQLDARDFPGSPRIRWRTNAHKHHGRAFAVSPHGIVLGVCDEQQIPDYYEDIGHELRVLDPLTGAVRLSLPAEWPLGLAGELLWSLDLQPVRRQRRIRVRSLRDLSQRFELLLKEDSAQLAPAPDGFYTWNQQDPDYRSNDFVLRFHTLDQPEAPVMVPIQPRHHIGYVHAASTLLAVQQWDSQPGQPSHVTVLDRLTHQPLWSQTLPHLSPCEVLVDELGWVDFNERRVEVYELDARLLWTGPGLRRCWLTSRWVVGEPSGWESYHHKVRGLVLLERLTGAACWLPWHEPDTIRSPKDVVSCGDTVWIVDQALNRLQGFRSDGLDLGWSPQPPLSPYGINRLEPLEDRLYAVSDAGDVVCLESEWALEG